MSLGIELYMPVDTGGDGPLTLVLFDTNITHNMTDMAKAVGLYAPMWRPHTIKKDITAGTLVPHLKKGRSQLIKKYPGIKKLELPGGWGTYETFLASVESYLEACLLHPKAQISVSR